MDVERLLREVRGLVFLRVTNKLSQGFVGKIEVEDDLWRFSGG